jgi:hypothetical protein
VPFATPREASGQHPALQCRNYRGDGLEDDLPQNGSTKPPCPAIQSPKAKPRRKTPGLRRHSTQVQHHGGDRLLAEGGDGGGDHQNMNVVSAGKVSQARSFSRDRRAAAPSQRETAPAQSRRGCPASHTRNQKGRPITAPEPLRFREHGTAKVKASGEGTGGFDAPDDCGIGSHGRHSNDDAAPRFQARRLDSPQLNLATSVRNALSAAWRDAALSGGARFPSRRSRRARRPERSVRFPGREKYPLSDCARPHGVTPLAAAPHPRH